MMHLGIDEDSITAPALRQANSETQKSCNTLCSTARPTRCGWPTQWFMNCFATDHGLR